MDEPVTGTGSRAGAGDDAAGRAPRANPIAGALATWFGCGLAPVAPGTFGSLGAIACAWPLWVYFDWPPWQLAPLAAAATPAAIWASTAVAAACVQKDPGRVVVDEVVGQWVALAGAAALTWGNVLAAFLLFRLFDIWKPFPIRRLEKLPRGTGIVADDLLAGAYAGVVLWAAGWFNR